MKIQCEVCEKAEAEVLCCSDEAALCKPCDITVHEANKLFQRHHRVPLQKPSSTTSSTAPLCDICKERKGYFFCLDDRALLCNDCDGAIHICNSHQRFLLSGVQASDQSLTKSSGCSTNLSSETYQIQSKASLNSQYSSEENEAGNSEHVVPERNQVAALIATSVTRDHRYQSYVARGGPFWLQSIINKEATGV